MQTWYACFIFFSLYKRIYEADGNQNMEINTNVCMLQKSGSSEKGQACIFIILRMI